VHIEWKNRNVLKNKLQKRNTKSKMSKKRYWIIVCNMWFLSYGVVQYFQMVRVGVGNKKKSCIVWYYVACVETWSWKQIKRL